MWIAFEICIYLQLKQRDESVTISSSVVNCFRNLYIFAAETTKGYVRALEVVLWIAFEICIYLQLKQLGWRRRYNDKCCELLSKFVYICSWNNLQHDRDIHDLLWIAFEICIYLQLKQPTHHFSNSGACCELLSKFVYICSWNNSGGVWTASYQVVNCFRNLYIFAAETTWASRTASMICCELLSKFVYICSWNNTIIANNWASTS